MSERFICKRCKKEHSNTVASRLILNQRGSISDFCSKVCLLKWLVFSLDSVTICEPYTPTAEEEARMAE
jgi:hypothetical protein